MVEDSKPKPKKEKKNGGKERKTPKKHGGYTNRELEHQVKLGLMRECMIYGKGFEASKAYFEFKGFTLGSTQFTELRNEIKSAQNAKEWFSKEALFVIEEDHMLSVERIRIMEDRLLQEFEQVASTNFYKYINAGTKEQEIIRNKAHDVNALLRIIQQFQSLQETKTKMFSATPLVQEIMEVHRRQEAESKIVNEEQKQEKEITN